MLTDLKFKYENKAEKAELKKTKNIKKKIVEKKQIDYIVINCSDVILNEDFKINDQRITIDQAIKKPEGLYLIQKNGDLVKLYKKDIRKPLDFSQFNVIYNGGSRNYSPFDTRTKKQERILLEYILKIIEQYPNIKICGQYHLKATQSPSFNVESWLKKKEIDDRHIETTIKQEDF